MCPTCANEMDRLNNLPAVMCHRCGTVIIEIRSRNHEEVDSVSIVPKLVERCREFHRHVDSTFPVPTVMSLMMEWNRLGIAEAINPLGDRPT